MLAEAQERGYSDLRATCSGYGRITDIPWLPLLRRAGISRDTFIGNLPLGCQRCGTGRPRFNDLMFGRRVPVYVPFDVLFVDGEDVRSAPLKERKAMLNKVVRRHRMQRAEPVLGDGRAAFKAVCEMDLEGDRAIWARRKGIQMDR
jgi:hypothetical protein